MQSCSHAVLQSCSLDNLDRQDPRPAGPQTGKTPDWQDIRPARHQTGKTPDWQDIRPARPQTGKTSDRQDPRLARHQTGKTSDRQDPRLARPQTGKTPDWQDIRQKEMQQIFHIFQIHEEDAVRISSAPDEPHQHEYEELIVGMKGSLDHFIDFKTTYIEAPLISYVAKGKMHRVIPGLVNGKCKMWVIRFVSEFIPETTFQLYSHYHDFANIKLQPGACYDRMLQLCSMMHDEMQQENPELNIVSHLLNALFSMIEAERKKQGIPDEQLNKTQNITFKNFLKILEENFRRPVGVDFYAEKLFMSSRNLNIICKNILNQSVSEIIETRKLIEAKNLLTNSELTISEIGFELGYKEKSHFTNVFKRKSGQTPSEFRNEMKKQLS